MPSFPPVWASLDWVAQSLADAQAAAQAALHSAWGEVEEEYGRINARLPGHMPALKGVAPSASVVHDAVEVVVPIRAGADQEAVLGAMREGFGGPGPSVTSYTESLYGSSRTVQMEVRPQGGRSAGAVRIQMFIPPPGGSEQSQVVISKRSAFTPAELSALGRLVRAANVTFSADQPAQGDRARRHGLHGGIDGMESVQREMEAALQELARGALGGLFVGPMRQLLDELERGMGPGGPRGRQGGAEEGADEDGEDAGSFGNYFPLQRDSPSDGTGGLPGMPAPPPAVAQRPKGRGAAGTAAGHDWGSPAAARAVEQLLAMGAQVFPPGSKDKMDWGVLAGYEEQKRTIEDCLLLPLLRPDVYSKLARATRKTFANNRPRAVLFEGPPGTGKTTSARVISSQAAVPLIYLPLEAVLSKWYGQSEQQLSTVFKAAEAMGGAIVFLDELDALGGNREGGLHEVSRRLLSVLLREMEGFDSDTKRTVVIGATNRKTDLDPALLSRFDLVLTFDLPDQECRRLILRQYAQQLSDPELAQLAGRTDGMSGRDLRDVCEHTERRWASKIIRGEVREEELPPLAEYLASAEERATAVQRVQQQATAAGAISRALGGMGPGGRSVPSWLGGWRQD
ncbi:hypothetical protein GPECTOR_11g153 [Gonium pectorale]|uniref:AAA+ ATPase domain-containing protein n=1 Tax=Gonium pectorale TaxID=33097 RepID=A0A150GPI0_GONPE|nr:hypothetical protein GPECTOR_11g153 [Gonium pectorale]|eukprot:KXZ51704.1 hypothetical protein GPECTOR_11g153 [Gonium pectorale]